MIKRILVPITFSTPSQNALRQAATLYDKAALTLLHVYPAQKYSRKYKFGEQKYSVGMRAKLKAFYEQHVKPANRKAIFLARKGITSDIIDQISDRYDLMVMSRRGHSTKENGYFSEKKLFITTKAHCPVLIMPITQTDFQFKNCSHIWHIKRKKKETEIVATGMKNLEINPNVLETKSFRQKNFLSKFWQNIVNYKQSHDEKLLKKIDEAHELEPIDLIVLVDNEPSVFTRFLESEVIHLFCKYDIPILIFPTQ